MAANVYDISIEQGSDFTITLSLSENGEPINTGDYTFEALIENKGVVISPTIVEGDGEVTISLTSLQTSSLPVGKGKFQFVISNGETTKLLKGRAYIDEEIINGD